VTRSPEARIPVLWPRIAARFELVDPEPTDDDAVAAFRAGIAECFTGLLGAAAVARIDLPPDYKRFLRIASGTWRWGDAHGYHLYGPSRVVGDIGFANRTFDYAVPAEETAWLVAAHWSDRHDVLLCCDRTDERFGTVEDHHDGHPWTGDSHRRWPSFADYLRSVA
jgi:hypothetical protein